MPDKAVFELLANLDEVERKLRKLLEGLAPGREIEPVVTFVRHNLAQSFKNGMAAADRARAATRAQATGRRYTT